MRSIEERNSLVESHLGLAATLAKRRHRTVHRAVQQAELLSAAYAGLIDAADKYNVEKVNALATHPFTGYASRRIVGAMNDYLRSCAWGTRAKPKRVRSLDASYDDGGDDNNNVPLKDTLLSSSRSTVDTVNSCEFFEKLIRGLPKPAKQAFRLYYGRTAKADGKLCHTMKDVAIELGISESRVSQILSQHIVFLNDSWENRKPELWEEASASK